jgi:hypothetical protein
LQTIKMYSHSPPPRVSIGRSMAHLLGHPLEHQMQFPY